MPGRDELHTRLNLVEAACCATAPLDPLDRKPKTETMPISPLAAIDNLIRSTPLENGCKKSSD
jgi:hypothetical protein